MGWSLSRYYNATLYEYTTARDGYLQRWERNTAWLARELMFTLISLSPDIKKHMKPNKLDILPLSIDPKPVIKPTIDMDKKVKEYENKLKHGL